MSRFNSIDQKLAKLAKELNGKLTTNRHEKMPMPNGYEELRIDWICNKINLAIQVYPTVNHSNSKLNKWNFGAWAWQDQDGERFVNMSTLRKDVEFNIITLEIDELLSTAIERLNNLSRSDLQSQTELYGN
jgi:hypothetical protein